MQPGNPVLPGLGSWPKDSSRPVKRSWRSSRASSSPCRRSNGCRSAHAFGRILAEAVCADDDYPRAPRSVMDGFAIAAADVPGELPIVGDVRMGEARRTPRCRADAAMRIPDRRHAAAPEPMRSCRSKTCVVDGDAIIVEAPVTAGDERHRNAAPTCAAARRSFAGTAHLHAPEVGVLATLGVTERSRLPASRRSPCSRAATSSSLPSSASASRVEIRDSNRYAVAASLRAMGAQPRHYPTLRDEADEFEAGSRSAPSTSATRVVVTGGSSVGERDRLPRAVEAIARSWRRRTRAAYQAGKADALRRARR